MNSWPCEGGGKRREGGEGRRRKRERRKCERLERERRGKKREKRRVGANFGGWDFRNASHPHLVKLKVVKSCLLLKSYRIHDGSFCLFDDPNKTKKEKENSKERNSVQKKKNKKEILCKKFHSKRCK